MTTENMSIHKAMVELKTLDKRIKDRIRSSTFAIANKHSNDKVNGEPVAVYKEDTQSAYQSVLDMIKRHEAIKRAVVMSNATKKIKVADKEYTVAEAIYMKTQGTVFLDYLKEKIAKDLSNAQANCEIKNSNLDDRAYTHVTNLFGGANDKKMVLTDEMEEERKRFLESQVYELVDPIDAKKQLEELEAKISVFRDEIDAALSCSNAVTEITISY